MLSRGEMPSIIIYGMYSTVKYINVKIGKIIIYNIPVTNHKAIIDEDLIKDCPITG